MLDIKQLLQVVWTEGITNYCHGNYPIMCKAFVCEYGHLLSPDPNIYRLSLNSLDAYLAHSNFYGLRQWNLSAQTYAVILSFLGRLSLIGIGR